MDSLESLQKLYRGCLQHKTKITTSLCFCTVLGRSEWQSVRATYYFFFHFHLFIYFYCSPVSILLLKIPKVSEYLSINRKQLNVALFADGSRRVRSVYIGAGHSYSSKEWKLPELLFRCFHSRLVFIPFFQYLIPLHFTSLPPSFHLLLGHIFIGIPVTFLFLLVQSGDFLLKPDIFIVRNVYR